MLFFFFFSSRRRHTRLQGDWSSDVCSSDLAAFRAGDREGAGKLQERLAPLDREVVGKLGPAGVKAAMDAVGGGLYGGAVRPPPAPVAASERGRDRESTRLKSSHPVNSYAVF